MPTIPNPKRSPLMPERKAQEGRKVDYSYMYQSARWRRLRKEKLAADPLCQCEECAKLPVPLPAQMVDHITPYRDGGDFYDWNNLQSMNNRCHNRKSGREAHKK